MRKRGRARKDDEREGEELQRESEAKEKLRRGEV